MLNLRLPLLPWEAAVRFRHSPHGRDLSFARSATRSSVSHPCIRPLQVPNRTHLLLHTVSRFASSGLGEMWEGAVSKAEEAKRRKEGKKEGICCVLFEIYSRSSEKRKLLKRISKCDSWLPLLFISWVSIISQASEAVANLCEIQCWLTGM